MYLVGNAVKTLSILARQPPGIAGVKFVTLYCESYPVSQLAEVRDPTSWERNLMVHCAVNRMNPVEIFMFSTV